MLSLDYIVSAVLNCIVSQELLRLVFIGIHGFVHYSIAAIAV